MSMTVTSPLNTTTAPANTTPTPTTGSTNANTTTSNVATPATQSAAAPTAVPPALVNINPNYLIQIVGTDEAGNPIGGNKTFGIIAPMPEEFAMDVAAHWHPVLGDLLHQALGSVLGNTAGAIAEGIGNILQLGGLSTKLAALTQLTWVGTDPVTFNIPLRFNAIYDANTEVMLPVFSLLQLNLPSTVGSTGNTLLRAPGPNFNPSSTYNVTIHIGRALTFSNVIITGVRATFNTLSYNDGNWLSADVDLTVSTSRILTKSDFGNLFKNTNTNQTGTSPFPANSGNIQVGGTVAK